MASVGLSAQYLSLIMVRRPCLMTRLAIAVISNKRKVYTCQAITFYLLCQQFGMCACHLPLTVLHGVAAQTSLILNHATSLAQHPPVKWS